MRFQQQYSGLLLQLDELKYQLPRSERRIAETVLENPEVVSYMRLNELAQAADVSIATVHRFCRSLGCEGFKELRQEIGHSVSTATARQTELLSTITPSASALPTMVKEITHSLSSLQSRVTERKLIDATRLVENANRAFIYSTDEDFHSTVSESASLLYSAGLPCEAQINEKSMGRVVPTLKKSDVGIFVLTRQHSNCNNWMGAVKQMGGNSLSISLHQSNQKPAADVAINLETDPANHFELLISQLSLTMMFTHLSLAISPS